MTCVGSIQDDKFLSVLYPNYITWLLQPMKYTSIANEAALFALHDSITELLTFCTEAHGYRVKYLFGRQPIASYVEQMLRSKNKLSVIRESLRHHPVSRGRLRCTPTHVCLPWLCDAQRRSSLCAHASRARRRSSRGSLSRTTSLRRSLRSSSAGSATTAPSARPFSSSLRSLKRCDRLS